MGTTSSKNYKLIHDYRLESNYNIWFWWSTRCSYSHLLTIGIMTPQLRGKSKHTNFSVHAGLCSILYYKSSFTGSFNTTHYMWTQATNELAYIHFYHLCCQDKVKRKQKWPDPSPPDIVTPSPGTLSLQFTKSARSAGTYTRMQLNKRGSILIC